MMPAFSAVNRTCALILRGFALAGLLCLASCARHVVSLQTINRQATKFDYFLLVRQWPGSYCSKHSCTLLHNRGYHFTIHGLWPNYDDGTWPQFCDASNKFDEDKLEDLMDELESEWPSTMDSDENFWEHEWSKHGTCSVGIFPTEHSYFSNVLKLHRRYDLAAALRKADIVPDKHKVYRAKDLADAIHDEYGVRPVVHCYDKELSEIWMCFDKDLVPYSCDEAHIGNTCQQLTIPPLRLLPEGDRPGGPETELAGDARRQQHQQQKQEGTVAGIGAGGDQLAATDTAAEAVDAPEEVATEGATEGAGSDLAAAAGDDEEATDGAVGHAEMAEGGLDDGMPYEGTVVEDSIYWLLEPDAVALLASASADAATTAAAAGGSGGSDSSTLGSEQQQQQQQLMDIQLIEQRLMQRDDDDDDDEKQQQQQLAVAALTATNPPSGTGALAVLAALAERTLSQLQQQFQISGGGGGGGSGSEPLNNDLVPEGQLPVASQRKSSSSSSSSSSSVSSLGAQDFVWTSKLRGGGDGLAFSADEAEERASLGDGGGGAALTAVTRDGASGPVLWAVQQVLVVPAGGVGAGAAAAPMWVVLLLSVQLICVVAISLALLVVTGMALVGARWGPREQRPGAELGCDCEEEEEEATDEERGRGQQEQRKLPHSWWSPCCGEESRGGAGELSEPLLLQSDEEEEEEDDGSGASVDMAASPPKIHLAKRGMSATEEEEEEEGAEEELERQQQHQQQRGWHVNPLLDHLGSRPVLSLLVAAAARSSPAEQQPYAPVH
ncbi:hypothetical protein PLESTB_000074700 [Pleodorina starrii]|uniref:Uncharacterized protein n=1 Tax=Pleodorina starrii TaxID=330485 RepID=A0A9W6BA07_9CHLO|nr:hypothetical protein PLESTB_000074700 [Pleodorina starrii]GLC66534.1 hypothetical protein PLESTF_000441000 [Pleodorina starrii]